MNITEKLKTNPELIEANLIIGDALNELIERKWGSIAIVFTAQNGKITTVKKNEETIFKLSDKRFTNES